MKLGMTSKFEPRFPQVNHGAIHPFLGLLPTPLPCCIHPLYYGHHLSTKGFTTPNTPQIQYMRPNSI
jgi:hypothetical protein